MWQSTVEKKPVPTIMVVACNTAPLTVLSAYTLLLSAERRHQIHVNRAIVGISGVVEPLMSEEKAQDFIAREINPTLLRALSEMCKQRPFDPVVSFSGYR
jgi:Dpy-30 motif